MSTAGPKYPFEQAFNQTTDDLLKYREVYSLFKGDSSEMAQAKQKTRELQAVGLFRRFMEYKTAADAYIADLEKQQADLEKEEADLDKEHADLGKELADANKKLLELKSKIDGCDDHLDALKVRKEELTYKATQDISAGLRGEKDKGQAPTANNRTVRRPGTKEKCSLM